MSLSNNTHRGVDGQSRPLLSRPVPLVKGIIKHYQLLMFLIPALVYILLFNYWPIYGIQIAFKEFSPTKGFWNSNWIGFKHFERFINYPEFWRLISNTLGINTYGLIVGFPVPIILSIMINELPGRCFKKTVQMVTYMPYFISTVAMCGMIALFLERETGLLNLMVSMFGGEKVAYLTKPEYFKTIYVFSGIWQTAGWGTVIYLAALSQVDINVTEAAIVDGARRLQRIWHVDFQYLIPTIMIQLILNLGRMFSLGFEKVLLLQNSLNMEASDIISTYVYRTGLLGAQFSYTAAIGLFNNIINFILLIIANQVIAKLSDTSVY